MARLELNGLDGLMDDLEALARLPDEAAEDILNAEAGVIVPAQQSEIRARWSGPYSLGVSAKSVKQGAVKKTKSGHCVSVYPKGSRKRGRKSVRNAEIAFINEYGAPRRGVAARPAIGTANAKAEQKAVEAGERAYHAYLDRKKL